MSRSKIVVFAALLAFSLGLVAIGSVMAAEKIKGRTVKYTVKWEQIEVGDEEGHVVAAYEQTGVSSILVGDSLQEGMVMNEYGTIDMNVNTGIGSAQGYAVVTDKDGDKGIWQFESNTPEAGIWQGEVTLVNGTGKYEGATGQLTSTVHVLSPNLSYVDWEGEWELP